MARLEIPRRQQTHFAGRKFHDRRIASGGRALRNAQSRPLVGIWPARRQADPEETATDFWIAHYALDLMQRFHRHFGVRMQKPENFAAGCIGSNVHLPGTAASGAPDDLIAQALRQLVGAVSASAIDDNNFRPRRSLAQIRQK